MVVTNSGIRMPAADAQRNAGREAMRKSAAGRVFGIAFMPRRRERANLGLRAGRKHPDGSIL